MVYPEDIPTENCDKHVLLDYCSGGKGVANEYCKHFAAVDSSVKLSAIGLSKMTEDEIDEILKASKFGLQSKYVDDSYVYYVTKDGKDANFKGFHDNINSGISAPYKVCTDHTEQSWERYKDKHPTVDSGSSTGGGSTATPAA